MSNGQLNEEGLMRARDRQRAKADTRAEKGKKEKNRVVPANKCVAMNCNCLVTCL